MLYKNVLSLFETETGLDFKLLEELLNQEYKNLLDDIADLDFKEKESFFKLLIDQKQFQSLGLVINHLEKTNTDYNSSLVVLAIYRMGKLENIEDAKSLDSLLKKIKGKEALTLLPIIEYFPEKIQKKIEASLMQRRAEIQEYKEELKEQIEFLKTQLLTEKALEIEEKLKFHFPEIKEQFLSAKQTHSKTEEQKFAKVIERNLSVGMRKEDQSTTGPARYSKNQEEERIASLDLARIWFQEMKDSNIDLLLTQLEFLNFENSEFYADVLNEVEDPTIWTKIVLYLKSEKYLEGLEFLEFNEQRLLTESPESIYNYYYTKGLLLSGAGMNKEAEEIFTLIKEQKGNFRDIQSLLQNAK
jgi:hypothetical protein